MTFTAVPDSITSRPGLILRVLSASLLLALAAASAAAQTTTTSASDRTTPPALAPGAPAGSYALSGFESVNPYNGNLNFRLPLLRIGGRGSAGYTITLSLNTKKWSVRHSQTQTSETWTPTHNPWGDNNPGYGPGRMLGRKSGFDPLFTAGCPNLPSNKSFYKYTLTTLTFTAADGTEYDFRDQQSGGARIDVGHCPPPFPYRGASRGRVWVTADGSSATFISDDDIYDQVDMPAGTRTFTPSGYLLLKDGTRYRISNGGVTWIRDRNGNQVSPNVDSLGRVVTIDYDVTDPTYGLCDRIHYSGFGGEARTIYVTKTGLGNVLRGDYTPRTHYELFPELTGSLSYGTNPYNPTVVSGVVLPDGRSYQFRYNSYGELARVVLPTGGAIEYDMAPGSGVVQGNNNEGDAYEIYRRVAERRTYPDGSTLESRTVYAEGAGTSGAYVEVRSYSGSTVLGGERHYFAGGSAREHVIQPLDGLGSPVQTYPAWDEGRETASEQYASDGTSLTSPLRVSVTSWQPNGTMGGLPVNPVAATTTTTLRDVTPNLVSKTTAVSPQTGALGFDQYNNPTDVWEYDYGSGAPGAFVRRTHTDYVTGAAYVNADVNPSAGASLRSLPSQQWVSTDAAGADKASLTTYAYDEFGLSDCPSVTGHDAGYGTGFNVRGNVTSVTRYADAAGGAGAVTGSSHYDIAGNVVSATDANGNTSTVSYTDSFSDGVNRNTYAFATSNASAVPDPSGQTGSSSALTTSSVYDFSTGLMTSATDPNGVVSSYAYADPLDRPTRAVYAVGTAVQAQTTVAYNDPGRTVTTTSDQINYNDNRLKSVSVYDGFGRTVEARRYETADAYISSTTRYDALGRAYLTSHPSRGQGATTDGWTRTSFDALGRVTEVATFAGATLPPPPGANANWTGSVTTSYSGITATVTDQWNRKRRSVTDALGRLVRVDEPDAQSGLLDDQQGNPVQPTYYAYDATGNLRTVTQGTQTRTFVYDSLSRLKSATNPESGTVSYTYDANGNLKTKTDGRGVVATYSYDALNRNTLVSYTGGTPNVLRVYDSAANGLGRPRADYTLDGNNTPYTHTRVDAYDAAGRPLDRHQYFCPNGTWGSDFAVGFTYNLSGAVTREVYPSGREVTYNYDAAGRLGDYNGQPAFAGNLGGEQRSYSSEVLYDQSGGMRQERFGTDTPLYHKQLYNSRGQLAEIRVGLYSLNDPDPDRATSWQRGAIINHYGNTGWGAGSGGPSNNGNLRAQDVFIPNDDAAGYEGRSTVIGQSYGYDYLNRLTSASESGGASWSQSYTYDRWGNRTVGSPAAQFDGGEFAQTNRLYAPGDTSLPMAQRRMRYDAAGNLTYDSYTGAGARSYDAENRMVWAQASSTQGASYTYDADGRRVKRNVGGGEVWQVYGAGGELLAEYAAGSAPSSPQKEYGYRGGELLVTAEAAAPGGWGAPPTIHDNPLVVGETVVRSQHITELRSAIDALRSHKGLGGYGWAAAAGVGAPVTAAPIAEMRAALDEALGAPAGGYSGGLAQGQPILAIHIQELRDRVLGAWAAGSGGGGVNIRWLVADQLGTPRMAVDKGGALAGVARHDYVPFGEEIVGDVTWRTAGRGYNAGDNVRQKFTSKERDIETGLDYFEARYFSSTAGRFSSVDPLLSSALIEQPQSWNRYSYTLNNPLLYTDPAGLYVFDKNVTREQRDRFTAALDQARQNLAKIAKTYGETSSQYKQAKTALDAYGGKDVNNGVTIFAKDGSGAGRTQVAGVTGTKTKDNPTGQIIRVSFDLNAFNTDYFSDAIAHEGSHVADGSAWVKSGFASSANPTEYQTEFNAHMVQSYFAEARLPDGTVSVVLPTHSAGKGKNPYLFEIIDIWNSGWAEADKATMRRANINKYLARPKSGGSLYGFTPDDRTKAFTKGANKF